MKFQPKRFVVEVKRGTSRAAFASPDPALDRFSGAEAALFGRGGGAEPEQEKASASKAEQPAGRVLRSLVEPPPVVPELPEPPRRGRKPGSKNKPKTQFDLPSTIEVAAERPRRGRKPGSKNKPKFPPASEIAATDDAQPVLDSAALMRSYGFADHAGAWDEPEPRAEAAFPADDDVAPRPAPDVAAPPVVLGEDGRARGRLRQRSAILRRYVLALEPSPGQPGFMRARRLARAGR